MQSSSKQGTTSQACSISTAELTLQLSLRTVPRYGTILARQRMERAIPDGVTTETGWMARQFIASSKLPLRFYLDAGAFEFDSNGTGGGILETSRDMRDVLLAKGYDVHYQQFAGGHDYLSWRGTFADGLIDLIGTTNRISIPS